MTLSKAIERAVRRGAGVTKIDDYDSVQPLWGGYGEVLRLDVSGGEIDSLIVKRIAPPGGTRRKKKSKDAHARTMATYDNELHFYQEYSERLRGKVRIPHFYAGQRLEDSWIFVLEDLLEAGFVAGRKEFTESDIKGALIWLARFHAFFLNDPGEGLSRTGSYWNLAARKADLPKMVQPKLKASAEALDRCINNARFKTIIHGDSKTDNFCFSSKGDELVAGFDFQHTGLGCGMKDVMCLLDSCLSAPEAEAQAADYLDFYFDALRRDIAELHPEITAREVEAEWRTLYPVAWADYYRFLDGWAPGKYPPEGFVEAQLNQALALIAARD